MIFTSQFDQKTMCMVTSCECVLNGQTLRVEYRITPEKIAAMRDPAWAQQFVEAKLATDMMLYISNHLFGTEQAAVEAFNAKAEGK